MLSIPKETAQKNRRLWGNSNQHLCSHWVERPRCLWDWCWWSSAQSSYWASFHLKDKRSLLGHPLKVRLWLTWKASCVFFVFFYLTPPPVKACSCCQLDLRSFSVCGPRYQGKAPTWSSAIENQQNKTYNWFSIKLSNKCFELIFNMRTRKLTL